MSCRRDNRGSGRSRAEFPSSIRRHKSERGGGGERSYFLKPFVGSFSGKGRDRAVCAMEGGGNRDPKPEAEGASLAAHSGSFPSDVGNPLNYPGLF